MNIFITEIEQLGKGMGVTEKGNQDMFAFSMLPEEITVETGTSFQTYNVIDEGEIKVPRGEKLTGFKWSGILPGEKLKSYTPLVKPHYWLDPKEIQSRWSFWRARGTKLRLMVTETTINHDVYLVNYTMKSRGAGGTQYYDIEFVHAKDMIVYTVDEDNQLADLSRPAQPVPATYTVRPGDSLWSICEQYYGDGSRCMDLYYKNFKVIDEANKANGSSSWQGWTNDKIDDPYDMYLIHTGTVLTML